ncbi:MAG: metallophosphoesterase [Nitrospiraceae bacterium]|nr:MAG: metallophosphoesterase [Nitrospiraceae bacterium]
MTRRTFLGGALFSGFTLFCSDSFYLEPYVVETNEYDIGVRESTAQQVRLLQISDLHLREMNSHYCGLAEKVNHLAPDLLLLTGDIIEKERYLSELDSFLGLIRHDIRKVAVTGNWEHMKGINLTRLRDIYGRNNGELLINEAQEFLFGGKRLVVTGIDDMLSGRPDFPAAVKLLGPPDNHIVLCHCPQYRDVIARTADLMNQNRPDDEKTRVDYVFAGHTHGGQVNIFGYAPVLPPGSGRYVRGWYWGTGPNLFVSKGVGTSSVFPVRLGARAEITLFNYGLV